MKRVTILLAFAASSVAIAQQATSTVQIANTASTTKPLPPHIVYRHFLKWVLDLDNSERAAPRSDPQKAQPIYTDRPILRSRLVDVILLEAKALDKDLAAQDAKAAAVVAHFRAVGKSALEKGLPLPPAPAELRELQQERDTLIKSHVSILRASLGSDVAAKLDAYLSGEFATHINLKAIAIPHAQTPPSAK